MLEFFGKHIVQPRRDIFEKANGLAFTLSDFYMHFLIGKADHGYMWFMWKGRKFQCIGMPFGLLPCNVMIGCGVSHSRTRPSRAQISWGN